MRKYWDRLLRREKTTVALLYVVVIVLVFIPVVFLGKTLVPSLYYPYGVVDDDLYRQNSREVENIFNVDLATPAYEIFPTNQAVGNMYRQGQIPLWNPYQAAGTPLAAQYSTRTFFPYQILEDISPPVMWDFFILGRLWIAGFFTYLFLTSLSLRRSIAFLGGIFYMFSGNMIWFINLEQMANVAMMVPLLLFCLERLLCTRRGAHVALSGIILALVLVAGQPETALYVVSLAFAYFVFRVVAEREQRTFLKGHLSRIGIVLIIGLGLSAPLLLPFLEFMRNSYNAHPPGGTMGLQDPTPLPWAIYLIMPTLSHVPTYIRELPHNGVWDYLGGYSGILVIYLVILGLFIAWKQRKYSLFFSFFGMAIVAKNFGFILTQWVGCLPLFDQVWSNRWTGTVWTFCFAVAGALCLQAVVERAKGEKNGEKAVAGSWLLRPKRLIFLGTVLFALGLGASIFTFGPYGYAVSPRWLLAVAMLQGLCISLGIIALLAVTVSRDKVHWNFITSVAAPAMALVGLLTVYLLAFNQIQIKYTPHIGKAAELGWDSLLLALVLPVATTVLVLSLQKNGRRGYIYGLIALAIASLWFYLPKGYTLMWQYLSLIPFAIGLIVAITLAKERWRWALSAGLIAVVAIIAVDISAPKGLPDRGNPYAEAPYVRFLREQTGNYRVIGGNGVLIPTCASAMSLYDLRYINSMSIEAYQHFLENSLVNQHHPAPTDRLWFTGMPYRDNQVERSIYEEIYDHLPSYSLLGVKYILAPASLDINENSSREKQVYFPLIYDGEIRVYENPQALPRVFITSQVEYAPSYQEAQEMVKKPHFDPRKTVILEEPAPDWYSGTSPSAGSEAYIETYQPNRVVIKARSEGPGILVLSDVYYKGWQAYVDREPARIYRVNGLIRGVFLAEGEHTIVFRYFPNSFTIGLAVAGLSALLCLALYLWRGNRWCNRYLRR